MNNIVQTVIDALTYKESIEPCIINYALIGVAVLPYLVSPIQSKENRLSWLWALITSVFVQVLIWFAFNAIGVSVIWCAVIGFNVIYFRITASRLTSVTRVLFLIGYVLALIGGLYYFVMLPLITTIAHALAFLMGIGLFYLYKNLPNKPKMKGLVS